jgi:hypothetical protein
LRGCANPEAARRRPAIAAPISQPPARRPRRDGAIAAHHAPWPWAAAIAGVERVARIDGAMSASCASRHAGCHCLPRERRKISPQRLGVAAKPCKMQS